MMEPIGTVRRVLHVSAVHPSPTTGEIPVIGDMQMMVIESAPDFDAFYRLARPSVGRALALTLRDNDLATDAVDEAMVRAYQRWDHVGLLDNPAGWVYRVGLNHARSRLRRLLRRVAPPAPESIAATEFTVADPAIALALDELSIDHRSVVVCRLLLGWSEAQTADALAIRPGTVKSRLSRASKQLERRLHHLRDA